MTASAKPAVPPVAHPRPFQTYYFASVRDAATAWSRVGRAVSLRGAARAALGHLIDRRYASAVIHNEAGVVVARVWREGRRIQIIGV